MNFVLNMMSFFVMEACFWLTNCDHVNKFHGMKKWTQRCLLVTLSTKVTLNITMTFIALIFTAVIFTFEYCIISIFILMNKARNILSNKVRLKIVIQCNLRIMIMCGTCEMWLLFRGGYSEVSLKINHNYINLKEIHSHFN